MLLDLSLFHLDVLFKTIAVPPEGHLLVTADLALLAEHGDQGIDSRLWHDLAFKRLDVAALEHDYEFLSLLGLGLLII
ncbi:hypothetical protein HG531_002356 [Fusarium graminearum]|nr:hypothetical protein HG531_002356 [Fusarium graminearum]